MSGPALVLVPDADARVDPGRPVLGVAPGLRLADAARRAGFAAVYVLPGTRASPPGACPGSAGDRLDTAALVVLESAAIEPAALLRLIHAGGEGSLFDERGRPVAWWSARLARLPAALPVTEALASPDAPSPAEVARLVDAGDRPRMEALIVRATAAEGPGRTADPAPPSPWRRWLELPLLRWLCARRWPSGQIEVVALLLAALAGAPGRCCSRAARPPGATGSSWRCVGWRRGSAGGRRRAACNRSSITCRSGSRGRTGRCAIAGPIGPSRGPPG